MTQTDTATHVTEVAALVHEGHIEQAKREARRVLAHADAHALEVIANCVAILETTPPKVAVPKLRHYWKVCGSEADRAIIAACAPDESARRTTPQPERATSQARTVRHRAARDLRTQVRPELKRRPDYRQAAALTRADRLTEDYQQHRAGVDDQPARQDRPDGYALDYDRAALPALRGLPCVRCWLERSTADHTGRQDDGLCTDCRERGRPGIPAPADGHTRADAIAAHNAPVVTHRILRREWARATTPEHRAAIAAWVADHPDAVEVADGPDKPHQAGACTGCGSFRAVRDGRCADCAAAQAAPELATA